MKHIPILLVCIFIATASAPAHAQESPAYWVKKLGSGSYPEREKAARMLEQIGKAALPALTDATNHADLETRRRVGIVMQRIEDKIAVELVLSPTPIALTFKTEFINSALRETSAQMGLPLGERKGEDYPIKLETGPVPYWRAWRQFRAAAKLAEADWSGAGGTLRRLDGGVDDVSFIKQDVERDELLARVLRFGPPQLAFAAEPVAAYAEDDRSSVRVRVKWHALDKALAGAGPSAIFAVEVRPEPRLEIVTVPRVEITKIVDADGKERPVQGVQMFAPQADPRDALLMSVFSGEIQFGGLLHLKAIAWPGPARPLKELHGRVRLEATARASLLELPGILKAQGKQVRGVDGITLKVLEAGADDAGQINLRLRFTHLDSLTPQTDEQKIVRVRPGVIAVRGAMDVAVERLRVRDAKGWLHHILASTEYKEVEKGCYEASVHIAPLAGRAEDFGLVLTKEPKTVICDMPFQVRDVAVPK